MGKKTKKSVSIGEYIIESGEEWQAKAYKIPRSVWAALKECARKHGFEFTPEKETTHSLGWKLLKEFCDGANSGTIGEYHIERKENGHINLYVEYKNTIGALREVARHLDGLEWDEKWNTRSAGRRIVDYALEHPELILKKAKEITTIGEYVIEIKDRKVRVYKEPRSAFAALRECAAKHKFEFTPEKETTHSLGWKLLKEFCDGANIGTIGEYHIERKENGHIDISVEYKNAIKALREMAKLLEGFEWDETWTTFDVARKVVEYALEHPEHVKKVKREKKAPVTKHTVGSTSSDIDHEALTEVDDDELEEDYEDEEDDDGETHDIEYYMEMAQVSDDDLKNAWTDESGVMYSADKKRLLKAPNELMDDYAVLPGTEVVCEHALSFTKGLTKIILPEGLRCIGGAAFDGNHELTEVILPEGLRFISHHAFESCTKLWDINIPSSVEVIENDAFHFCKLKSFTFPKSLDVFYGWKSMPDEAEECFSETPDISVVDGCVIFENKLLRYYGKETHVVIPEGVTAIGDLAFIDRKAITGVSIPSSVTEIGEGAFNGCSSLQSIELPDSVSKIGIDTFGLCHSLQSVVLSKGLTEIPLRAFSTCEKLESVVTPEGVATIASCAFSGNNALKSINIPQSVTSIGESAFWRCYALESIDIPASVTSIGDGAFSDCMLLQTINIHGNPVIGKDAFRGCPGYDNPEKDRDRIKNVEGTTSSYEHFRALAKVGLEEINNAWKDERGVKYSADKKRLIIAPQNIEGEYTVLPETEVICRMAFNEAVKLTKVVLPEGLQFIGEYSFHYCLGLKSIDIPQSVDYIDEGAFARCFDLETINILGTPRMGEGAFAWCKGNKKV